MTRPLTILCEVRPAALRQAASNASGVSFNTPDATVRAPWSRPANEPVTVTWPPTLGIRTPMGRPDVVTKE